MRGIHEDLQIDRRAIDMLKGKRVNAVGAPIPRYRELSDWHYFDGRHAKGCKLIQRGKQRSESSFARKCSNVQFIEDAVLQRQTFPVAVRPFEGSQVDQFGRSVNSIRLAARRGIRTFLRICKTVQIFRAGLNVLGNHAVISQRTPLHGKCRALIQQMQFESLMQWRPNREIPSPSRKWRSTQGGARMMVLYHSPAAFDGTAD